MIPDTSTIPRSTWLRATELLPSSILQRISRESAGEISCFLGASSRYHEMNDADLLRVTRVCLQNLDRLYPLLESPDIDLQTVLVPELWERLQTGTRDGLRHLTSTLLEYHPAPDSFWKRSRFWSEARETALQEAAHRLRARVERLAGVDTGTLIEEVRRAIAGSCAADKWGPAACVYEPGFTYRLVPALALRVRNRYTNS